MKILGEMKILEQTENRIVFLRKFQQLSRATAILFLSGTLAIVLPAILHLAKNSDKILSHEGIFALVLACITLIIFTIILTMCNTISYEFDKSKNSFTLKKSGPFLRHIQNFKISDISSVRIKLIHGGVLVYIYKIDLTISNKVISIGEEPKERIQEIFNCISLFLQIPDHSNVKRYIPKYSEQEVKQFQKLFKEQKSRITFFPKRSICLGCSYDLEGRYLFFHPDSYCPECGSFGVNPGTLFADEIIESQPHCNSCGKDLSLDGLGDRTYKIRACPNCGLFLDEKGI